MEIKDLQERLHKLNTTYSVYEMQAKKEAERAVSILQSIDADDAKAAYSIAPALQVIMSFSVQDIQENKNGEIDMIKDVQRRLAEFLDERVKFYEEH